MMHVSRSHTLYFKADIAIVFPLFTPLEERKWVPAWDAHILFSETGAAKETGCIFSTRGHGHDDILWVLSRYDKEAHIIQYVRFAAGHHIAMIDIHAEQNTHVQVTYTLTSLSEAGQRYIQEDFSEEAYNERMQHWQHDISRYLSHLAPLS